ncbi:MAG: hypothetical protein MZV49_27195 [Rhodopseudomonas palustris]|uniref:hypothetical protein n=1 Tax=Rhodopseudomonas pseudopalustris TaxID=1513892 RepID=UPI000C9F206A|nr:hypothetical protein [Rhodopseudomonas palustris]
MTKRHATWDTRSTVSKWAHVFERSGLAMAGASCGLFVAALMIRANINMGGGVAALAMTLYGGFGFYLGIDLPPPLHKPDQEIAEQHAAKTDTVELLSAAGTFFAALTAVLSVYLIVVDERLWVGVVMMIAALWLVGTTLQVAAGVIARLRRNRPSN